MLPRLAGKVAGKLVKDEKVIGGIAGGLGKELPEKLKEEVRAQKDAIAKLDSKLKDANLRATSAEQRASILQAALDRAQVKAEAALQDAVSQEAQLWQDFPFHVVTAAKGLRVRRTRELAPGALKNTRRFKTVFQHFNIHGM